MNENIEIDIESRTEGLEVSAHSLRPNMGDEKEFQPHFLDMILKNNTKRILKSVAGELRYYDRNGAFLGVDDAFHGLVDALEPGEDRATRMSGLIPDGTKKAILVLKAKHQAWADRHALAVFCIVVVACLLLYIFKMVLG